MNKLQRHRRAIGEGTDVPTYRAVQEAVERLVRRKWPGWSEADRQDLTSLVMEKFFTKYGRRALDRADNGEVNVPIGWLSQVVSTTGIDMHRMRQVRHFDLLESIHGDPVDVERAVFRALVGHAGLSTLVADQIDVETLMATLSQSYPNDVSLVRWSVIEGRPLSEVAELAGKSEVATRKAVQRALLHLKALV